jgi:hypothetical protein
MAKAVVNKATSVHQRLLNLAMRAEAAPAPTEEFTPQSVTVTAHVNALFNLK